MINQLKQCLALLDRRQRGGLIGLAALMLTGAVLEAVGVGMIFPLILLIGDPGKVATMPIVEAVGEAVASGDSRMFLLIFSGTLFAFFVFKNAFVVFYTYVESRFLCGNEAALALRLAGAYFNNPYTFHLTHNSAQLIRNVKDCVSVIISAVIKGYLTLLTEALVMACIGAVIISLEPVSASIAIASLAVIMVLFYVNFRRRYTEWGQRTNRLRGEELQWLQQGLRGVKEITVLGTQSYFERAFARARREAAAIEVIVQTMGVLPRVVIETLMVGLIVGMIFATVLAGRDLTETLALLGLFAAAAFRVMPSANRALLAVNGIKWGQKHLDEVYEDLMTFRHWSESRAPKSSAKLPFNKSLRVEDVSYVYPVSERNVLDAVSFEIRRGEATGLVGASGAGKTTLADLILGLLSPTEGRITVDGADIADVSDAWRRNLGYVPQSIFVMDDTLKRNVALGQDDGAIDDERMRLAIRLAQLDDVVAELPAGLDSILGENGIRLSGGQRQRVGIARALYNDPELLVLDEATSSLDTETEHEISKAIEFLSGKKTLIIIAHRLSTVRSCKRILFMKEGKLVDHGTFDELRDRNKDFRRLVELSGMSGQETTEAA